MKTGLLILGIILGVVGISMMFQASPSTFQGKDLEPIGFIVGTIFTVGGAIIASISAVVCECKQEDE